MENTELEQLKKLGGFGLLELAVSELVSLNKAKGDERSAGVLEVCEKIQSILPLIKKAIELEKQMAISKTVNEII